MPLLRRVIGSVLRRVRQRQGRTLKEVAADAGVSLPYLSEVERGTKEASSEILAAICRALGLPMTDLLDLVRDEMLRQPAVRQPMVRQQVRPAGRYEVAASRTRRGPVCSVGGGRRPARRSAGGRPRTGLARMSARLLVTC
ncbi:helix-turn-helix domain-containing protein [Actinoplanes siamensis]|uniref:HTH cro/C1-type domain-containing protein n=1 Tax=Actinoplanes siamensis TaxID=1223317 RepID=A0A919N7C2_9ACTN|nr:hypothetical protein Asi03nite_32410 [Actinoplanes siamensis]